MKTNPKDVFLQEAAPRGATHYRENKNGYEWFKIDTSVYEQDPEWEWEILTSDPVNVSGWLDCVTEIPKPSHQETPDYSWNGEGLPPAGTECEVLHRGKWHKTYIIGICRDGLAVHDCHSFRSGITYNGISNPKYFRPIRTERDEFIKRAKEILERTPNQNVKELAVAMYDDGARFLEDIQ